MSPANIRSITSQGSPHGRFRRAVEGGWLLGADAAARELGRLSLADALAFLALLAEHQDGRFEPAAGRWRARLEEEKGPLMLREAQLVVATLAACPPPPPERVRWAFWCRSQPVMA